MPFGLILPLSRATPERLSDTYRELLLPVCLPAFLSTLTLRRDVITMNHDPPGTLESKIDSELGLGLSCTRPDHMVRANSGYVLVLKIMLGDM